MKNKTKIDSDFVKNGAKGTSNEELNEILDRKSEIEHKISNSGILTKYTELGKMMLSMLNDYRKGAYKRVPWFTIATVAFTLLYVLNPLDMVPDFIPIVGFVDDMSVLAIGLNFIETDLHAYLTWKDESVDFEEISSDDDTDEEDYDYEY